MTLKVVNKKTQTPLVRNIQWFDYEQGKMLHFQGGDLKFKYDPKLNKSIPYTVDVMIDKKDNNRKDILEWINKNTRDFDISVISESKYNIVIDVPESKIGQIERELYQHRIIADF